MYSTIKVHQAYTERWPSTLTVKIAIEGTSVQYSKSAAFPVKFEDATSDTAEDVLTKKATELAFLTVGKRTTEKIREVAVVASNFKSSTGARERTREEIMAAEADRLPKLFLRSREQQLKRHAKENAERRVRAKRARNERWIEALQPLPPLICSSRSSVGGMVKTNALWRLSNVASPSGIVKPSASGMNRILVARPRQFVVLKQNDQVQNEDVHGKRKTDEWSPLQVHRYPVKVARNFQRYRVVEHRRVCRRLHLILKRDECI